MNSPTPKGSACPRSTSLVSPDCASGGDRRDTWLAPIKGRFTGGLSLSHISEEVERQLASVDEAEVMKSMKKIASMFRREEHRYGVVLFVRNGEIGLLAANNSEVELRKMDVTTKGNMFYAQVSEDPLADAGQAIIAASLSKLSESEDGTWWISRSGCKTRASSIIEHIGSKQVINSYIPCLFSVLAEGVKVNIGKAFTKEAQISILEEKRRLFEEIIGLPVIDHTPLTKKRVVYGTEIRDEKVKEKLNKLRKYMVSEKKKDIAKREVFTKVMERIALRGSPDIECLRMIQRTGPDGDSEKRAMYRVGAFLPNGGFFLEYTRYAYRSNDVGWFPLKFNINSEGSNVLTPVKNGQENIVAETLFFPKNLHGLQPKIFCVFKGKNGKKLVNGCLYCIEEIRKRLKLTVTKECECPIVPMISLDLETRRIAGKKRTEKKGEDCNDENKHVEKTLAQDLPITVMRKNDEWYENKMTHRGEERQTNIEYMVQDQVEETNGETQTNEGGSTIGRGTDMSSCGKVVSSDTTRDEKEKTACSCERYQTSVGDSLDAAKDGGEYTSQYKRGQSNPSHAIVAEDTNLQPCSSGDKGQHETHVVPEDEAEPLGLGDRAAW